MPCFGGSRSRDNNEYYTGVLQMSMKFYIPGDCISSWNLAASSISCFQSGGHGPMQSIRACWWPLCSKFDDWCLRGCCFWGFSWGLHKFSHSRKCSYCPATGICTGNPFSFLQGHVNLYKYLFNCASAWFSEIIESCFVTPIPNCRMGWLLH